MFKAFNLRRQANLVGYTRICNFEKSCTSIPYRKGKKKGKSFMRDAYSCKEEYGPDGKFLKKRERSIDPIVPWAIVALATLLAGRAVVTIPPSFWEFFKR